MLLVLAPRCAPGIPSVLSPLRADDDLPHPARFSDLFSNDHKPKKRCYDEDGNPAWCGPDISASAKVNSSKSEDMYANQAIKLGMDPMGCVAAEGAAATTSWCQMNCADKPPNCPTEQCTCTSVKDMVKASDDEAKAKRGALPEGGDPSTCKAVGDGGATDEWCVSNCGDNQPLCPPDLCVCDQQARLPKQQEAASASTTQPQPQPANAVPQWDPSTVPTYQGPTGDTPSGSTPLPPKDPPQAVSTKPAIYPGGDPATCQGVQVGMESWCKSNCAEVPPLCPSDICVCSKRGDPKRHWPSPKKQQQQAAPDGKPPPQWDPRSIPQPKPWSGKAPEPPEPAIFPGGDPSSCDKVDGQMISSTEWCQLSCADVPPNCPSDLCLCTKKGDKKKEWPGRKDKEKDEQKTRKQEEEAARIASAEEERKLREEEQRKKAEEEEARKAAEAAAEQARKEAVEKGQKEEEIKRAEEAAAERARKEAEENAKRDDEARVKHEAEEKAKAEAETEQAKEPQVDAASLPHSAAPPALKKGGDPAGCVAAEGQTMASTAWCVANCGKGGQLCTTDLCTCGVVHSIPQAIHPGGDPKTCTAVPGQLESNDAWCVNNCDVNNWKAQPPQCPSNLCLCKVKGDRNQSWVFPEPAQQETKAWDPSTIPTAPLPTMGWDPSTVPTYGGAGNAMKPKEVKQAIFPGGDPQSCTPAEGAAATTEWCISNCADVPPNCPRTVCKCADKGNTSKHWPTAKSEEGPKMPPAPKGKPGTSAIKAGQDAAFCVAADGAQGVSNGWCIMMCGISPQECDASMCYCYDNKVNSAIYPGGDPTSCKAKPNSGAEDQWCVDNCGDEPPTCPDYLCKCSKPGNKDKAPGSELPKGVKEAPIQSALPEGGDASSCIALQGKFEPDDPDRPTDVWCQSNCAKDPPECPVEKCFCADENAILTFGGDDATSTSDPVRQDEHKLQQTTKPIPQDVEDTHSAQYLCMKYNTHCALAAVERRAHSERYHAEALAKQKREEAQTRPTTQQLRAREQRERSERQKRPTERGARHK